MTDDGRQTARGRNGGPSGGLDGPPASELTVAIDARYLRSAGHSGIGRYTANLIDALLEIAPGLRLRLVTHPERPRPVESERVSCEPFRAPPNSLRTRFGLVRWFDFDGVDLFHSPFNILPAGLPVPAVFTLHDIMWLIRHEYCTQTWWKKLIDGTFFKTLIPRSVREADRVLTVSHYSREAIESWFPESSGRVHVAYNAVDDVFSPVAPEDGWPLIADYLPPRSRFVLVVGQGAPYKNHAGALEGFIEAFADDPDTYFVLIRRSVPSDASRLEELLNHRSVAPRIVNLDYVDFEELKAFYSLARAFLFPSLYEGFGLPQLEAMACGTPVVTSRTGAPAEVGGEAAVKVDPESPSAIACALERLAHDEAFYRRHRRAGLERAAEFTWERCARETLGVYRRIVAEASTAVGPRT